jgi:hypothetical protein
MKIFLPVAVREDDYSTSEGQFYEISDQPYEPGRFRPIFRTRYSELAAWLAARLNAYPAEIIDTDARFPSIPDRSG